MRTESPRDVGADRYVPLVSSFLHEAVLDMFRHRPGLAADLLAGPLGLAVPEHAEAPPRPAEVTELRPAEHRADTVVVLRNGDRAVWTVVVEIQLRPDDDKPWIWPEYLVGVRRRLRCPAVLLVVCRDTATARWAATPIDLGPDDIPVLTDPSDASRTPELAVLSALFHVHDDGPFAVLDALVEALDQVDPGQAVEYAHLILSELPAIARGYLEELMSTETYEYQSEFTRRLEARGETTGRAKLLLRQLAARGVTVPPAARERITACTDPDQLDTWGVRVLNAQTVEDLFT